MGIYQDHVYLLMALSSGVCSVTCPEARVSLQKLGFMTPAKVRERYYGNPIPHCMALTKKGQKRAQEISNQIKDDRKALILSNKDRRRGFRGAAWPKSWKLDTRNNKKPFEPSFISLNTKELFNEAPQCADCDSKNLKTEWVNHKFDYGSGTDLVELQAFIPVETCQDCNFSTIGKKASTILDETVRKHLSILLINK